MFFDTRGQFSQYTTAEIFSRIAEFSTLNEMWDNSVKSYLGQIAISYKGTDFLYEKLDSDISEFRGVLKEHKLFKGDIVGLIAGNSYDFVKAFLASVTMGIVVLIIPAYMDKNSIEGSVLKYDLSGIIYDEGVSEKIKQQAFEIPIIDIKTTGTQTPSADNISDTDPCVMMFTGGTTGKNKCALLSHGAVMQGVINGCYGYEDVFNQRYLLVLPLYHVFGLIRNLLTSIYTGSTLYICSNTKDMFKDIAIFKPTILVVVPALLEMAYELSQQFGRNMLGESLKYVICGAAHVPAYLIDAYKKQGVAVFPGYGLTETANLVSGNPESIHKPDSVGIVYPHQEIEIKNNEICIKGRNIMTGYVGDDTPSFDKDGWFHTGDLGYIDDEGFLYITGRIKEMIVLPNGENISPEGLEAEFETCSLIRAAQVFEDVNENGGHILSLEIVPRMSEIKRQNITDANKTIIEAMEKINSSFPEFQRVSKIVVRDMDFERNSSMKIVRYKNVFKR